MTQGQQVCPKCGEKVYATDAQCMACGASLTPQPTARPSTAEATARSGQRSGPPIILFVVGGLIVVAILAFVFGLIPGVSPDASKGDDIISRVTVAPGYAPLINYNENLEGWPSGARCVIVDYEMPFSIMEPGKDEGSVRFVSTQTCLSRDHQEIGSALWCFTDAPGGMTAKWEVTASSATGPEDGVFRCRVGFPVPPGELEGTYRARFRQHTSAPFKLSADAGADDEEVVWVREQSASPPE